jgi:mannan endo-1,4-beta-mannosidase
VTQPKPGLRAQWGGHRGARRARKRAGPVTRVAAITAVAVVAAIAAVAIMLLVPGRSAVMQSHSPTVRYLGVYEQDAIRSYAAVDRFAHAIGRQPNLVSYYSAWLEPFQVSFAMSAAQHGAVPLVQINPTHVSLTAIASGNYDSYLSTYAAAVRSYRRPVILSFGHEMNGQWYSWGYRRASPLAFVAAWRHIVSLFRELGVTNVTWLWTVNVIDLRHNRIASPAPWWPGGSYVNWVGIDGYYHKASWTFESMFGPTITAVRGLTSDPILIAETGAAPNADQPAKITDLFAGIRAYGLLGFLWFNSVGNQDWRLNSAAAVAAFRQGAKT